MKEDIKFKIEIPQNLSHKYFEQYDVPECILIINQINGNLVAKSPKIIDVKPLIKLRIDK